MDLDPETQSSGKIDTAIPRQLVLDYLLHNCYGETARAFMKDDLDTVRDTEVRKGTGAHASQNGIHSNGTSSSHETNGTSAKSQGQGGVMVRNASDDSQRRRGSSSSYLMVTETGEVDLEGDSPMGESYLDSTENTSTSTFTVNKAHALHVDEQLKNLETRKAIRNLISHGDIGSAMELCNSAFPGVLSIHGPLTSPASIQMNFKLQCQKFIELVKSDPERGPEALMFAQQVLHDFGQLDPSKAEMYTKQMEGFLLIIAYPNPEDSPNGHYLKQEAREQLADNMNSAILGCNGMSCEPALLTIVKQATVVQDQLAALESATKSRRGEPKKNQAERTKLNHGTCSYHRGVLFFFCDISRNINGGYQGNNLHEQRQQQ
ncbi:Ran-binding protein 9 [Modicella reniformis]|uniref:Ran-binding protein 9 n=1 Tax=Modicella reniformis TaxID=1440133 RepID=A0A9P6J6S9_9FUNG|nr:Ran-binding protein 9 [Modicella reniformis]